MRHVPLLVVLMILGPHPTGPVAQTAPPDPLGYVCYRATSPVAVDGRLDDGAWRDAPWTDDFVDIEGDKKPRPTLRTRAKMLWDDTYFYIGAELVEPHLWATITQHDAVIFHDNDFEFFIDPNGDNHEYYEFEINALGTGWDLLLPRPYKDGGKAVNNWEIAGLKSAVHLDGTLNARHRHGPRVVGRAGGAVERARRAGAADLAAGATAISGASTSRGCSGRSRSRTAPIVRSRERRENNWVWSPQDVINMHRPETWGYVQFSTARARDRHVQARRVAAGTPLAPRGLLRADRLSPEEQAMGHELRGASSHATPGWFTHGRQPPHGRDAVGGVRRAGD